MMSLSFILIAIIILFWLQYSTKRVLSGICPRGRMSCLGKYRRNVLTLNSTYLYLIAALFHRVASPVLAHYASELSPAAHFWLWNITGAIWGEGAYLVLPWLLTVPQSSNSSVSTTDFYVRKPVMQPRPELYVGKPALEPMHSIVIQVKNGKTMAV